MNKQQFITSLRKRLAGLPSSEVEERIDFYSEMIDDRVEDGISEEEAVSEIGSVDDIAEQIAADIPLVKIAKEKIKSKKRLGALEIVLLALGSPIWLSLLIAAFAVFFSIWVVLWSVVISLWSVFVSLAACALGGVAACPIIIVSGNDPAGITMLAAGMLCAGLSIFAFYGCKAATKGVLILTKKIAVWIKNCFIKKEEHNE